MAHSSSASVGLVPVSVCLLLLLCSLRWQAIALAFAVMAIAQWLINYYRCIRGAL